MFFKSKYSKSSYLHNEYYSSFTAEKFRNSCVDDYSVTLGGTNKHVVINELDNTNYSQRNMNLSQISLNMLSAYCLCESDCHDNLALRSLNQVATDFGASECKEQLHSSLNSYCLGCNSNLGVDELVRSDCIQTRPIIPRVTEQTYGSKITRRNMRYFRELDNYSYSVESKVEPLTGKQYTAYICRHPSGCTKEFERPWNLLDHIRIHYDVRPHTCPFCSLTFVQKGNRNKHVLIHLKKGEKLPNFQDLVMKSDNIFEGKKYIEKYC